MTMTTTVAMPLLGRRTLAAGGGSGWRSWLAVVVGVRGWRSSSPSPTPMYSLSSALMMACWMSAWAVMLADTFWYLE